MSIVRIFEKFDRVVTAPHCIVLDVFSKPFHRTICSTIRWLYINVNTPQIIGNVIIWRIDRGDQQQGKNKTLHYWPVDNTHETTLMEKALPCHIVNMECWTWIDEMYMLIKLLYDDVIKWKHFSRYWPNVRGSHRSPVNSPYKGQWRGALMFSLMYAWTDSWENNGDAGDLRRHRAHYDVIVRYM